MIRIKHATKTKDITILVNAHIIYGNASVGLVPDVEIQFHIIGKFVFNLIQLQSHHHPHQDTPSCA